MRRPRWPGKAARRKPGRFSGSRGMWQEKVEIVRQVLDAFQEGLERNDPGAAFDTALVADDAEWIPARGFPGPRRYRGREGFIEFMSNWTEDFEGWSNRIERVIDAGNDRWSGSSLNPEPVRRAACRSKCVSPPRPVKSPRLFPQPGGSRHTLSKSGSSAFRPNRIPAAPAGLEANYDLAHSEADGDLDVLLSYSRSTAASRTRARPRPRESLRASSTSRSNRFTRLIRPDARLSPSQVAPPGSGCGHVPACEHVGLPAVGQ